MPSNLSTASSTNRKLFWLWLVVAAVIIVADQQSKAWVSTHFFDYERYNIWPFFDLTLMYNTGAAFSFLAGGSGWQKWFFIGVAAVATVLILYWLHRNPNEKTFCLALSLILGGAIGNVLDRLQHGHVVDFLLFYWKDAYFPAFNVADIAITLGAFLLIADEFRRLRKARLARSK